MDLVQPEYNPVIILEGPDCSGKTTLANQLMAKYRNHVYIHNAVCNDIEGLHLNALTSAIKLSRNFVVIIDRLHLSEQIYGKIFRNKVAYDTKKFENNVNTYSNIYKVLCLTDKETTLKLHKERKNIEMFDDVSKIWDAYNEVKGWKRYDWQKDTFDLKEYKACY